jgi:succinylarginine dihydrolase
VLTPDELGAAAAGQRLEERLYTILCEWVRRRYRDRLAPFDLADPQLIAESRSALDELDTILAGAGGAA